MNHLYSLMLITHFHEKVDYCHPFAVVKEQHTIGIQVSNYLAINVRWTVRYKVLWRIRNSELPHSTIHCKGQVVKNYTIFTSMLDHPTMLPHVMADNDNMDTNKTMVSHNSHSVVCTEYKCSINAFNVIKQVFCSHINQMMAFKACMRIMSSANKTDQTFNFAYNKKTFGYVGSE